MLVEESGSPKFGIKRANKGPITPVKDFEANVLSFCPQAGQIEELWVVCGFYWK